MEIEVIGKTKAIKDENDIGKTKDTNKNEQLIYQKPAELARRKEAKWREVFKRK